MRQDEIMEARKEQEGELKEHFLGRVDKEPLFESDFRQSNFTPQGYNTDGVYNGG